MELKDFVENFSDDSKIKVTYKDGEVLYEGEAKKLLSLLKAKTKKGTGKMCDSVTCIEVIPY